MNLIDRVKNICLTPNTEWPVIAAEPSSTASLITDYVAPLAAVGAVAGFIGGSIVGRSTVFTGFYRVPVMSGLIAAIFLFVMSIVGVLIVAFIINALAPTFGAEKNSVQAMKVAVYSFTPGLLAGVLNIVPALGILGILLGLYGLYLLYLGLQSVMKAPRDKAAGYTAVVLVCCIIVGVVGMTVVGVVGFTGAVTSGLLRGDGNVLSSASTGSSGSGGFSASSSSGGSGGSSAPGAGEVQYDKNSALGRLQELSKAMEESSKKVDAAQKSGDSNAAAAAAMEGLGTLFGGGRRVDPLEINQIKAFLPQTVAGLTKQGNGTAEKSGMAGLMVSRAEANYSDGGTKQVTVGVSDPGGATGLVGLASWATVQTSREDDNGTERTTKVNGRMVHEKTSKGGGDEYSIIIGDRFIVSATSRDVRLDQLKAIVSSLDLAKLESMKDVGVQKK